jgi:hypothetical protein
MKAQRLSKLTAALLFLQMSVSFGQAPDLGAAAGFALFSSAGAFGNIGFSHMTGDVGNFVGAFTGFPPGTVVGNIHVADPTSALAASDLNTAYISLSGVGCDSALAPTLGNGQVLVPGVYCIGTAATLTGDLVLDAQSDPAAVFIIKIDGAFATGFASRVRLSNSATLCNVYWQVTGAVDIGVGSLFQGSILGNGRISLLGGSTLLGRGLTRAGAIYVQDDSVVVCTQADGGLPISLLSFQAVQSALDSSINLIWRTASEQNSSHFQVERSSDGIQFSPIGMCAAAGSSSILIAYSFKDENPIPKTNYYRLLQVDMDGTSEYSAVVAALNVQVLPSVGIYPNPFSSNIHIRVDQAIVESNCWLEIFNAQGIKVLSLCLQSQASTLETGMLASGLYYYKVSSSNTLIADGWLANQP